MMETTLPAKLIAAFHEGVAGAYLKAYLSVADKPYYHTLQANLLAVTNAMLARMKKEKRTAYADATRVVPTLEHPYGKQLCMAAAVVITANAIAAGTVLKNLPSKEVTLA